MLNQNISLDALDMTVVLEPEHQMKIMGANGDTKLIWDSAVPDEVDNARRTFEELVGEKHYQAYSVKKGGEKGSKMTSFDPEAEKIILAPRGAGG